SNDIKDDSVQSKDIKNDTIKQRDLSEGLKDKVNRTGAQGPAGPRGPQGPAGPAGTNANIDAMLAGEDATWTANGASSFSGYAVTLVTDGTGDGTSVETTDFNHPVQAGDMISFEFQLKDGAQCTAGAPRMFVTVNDTTSANSWDQNIDAGEQCGDPEGEVVFTAPATGTITDVGFVYDAPGIAGTVYITDVLVDGLPVFLG
ncbi:MAG TPA: collagen-like protein, partial [Nocardioides sp.]